MQQKHSQRLKRALSTSGIVFSALLLAVTISGGTALAAVTSSAQMKMYTSASQEFGVPADILLAISYNQTRWQNTSQASVDGGFGPMDLRAGSTTKVSGRDGSVVSPSVKASSYYTLDQAAQILHVPSDSLKNDAKLNIRGGAAVLANQARQLHHGQLPSDTADWYDVVAQFSGAVTAEAATAFADSIFGTIKTGATAVTNSGQAMRIDAKSQLQPHKDIAALGLKSLRNNTNDSQIPQAECPPTLSCNFVPASYTLNNPSDLTDYGNYDKANRPADMPIKYIFIHDTEGSYDSAIAHFQDPTSYVSSQYVVRSSDGAITQMVRNKDVSWGVYDWYDNMHGINIENEGIASQGANWYTPAMYQKEAELVRWLAAKYHIPLDRQHILGHDNIPVLRAASFPNQHWDPGPYWNWTYFMDLVQGKSPAMAQADSEHHYALQMPIQKGNVVTIAPTFATNQPPVTDCHTGTCVPLPQQGTNFVYLHTQPNSGSALLNEQYAHPGSTEGTTNISDWGDRAPTGFKYVVADVQGDWTGIWFAGQVGWFYNPQGEARTAERSLSLTVTPKAGHDSVAVYGGAYPEANAYPADIPIQTLGALYNLPAGQSYTTNGGSLPTDYFYAMTIDSSLPDDHMVVRGNQKYYQITVNHRIGYVKASDVDLSLR